MRNVAIYFMRRLRGETLKAIGEAFGIESHSTVSSIVERAKREIKKDRSLKKRIGKLKDLLVMSQPKTCPSFKEPFRGSS